MALTFSHTYGLHFYAGLRHLHLRSISRLPASETLLRRSAPLTPPHPIPHLISSHLAGSLPHPSTEPPCHLQAPHNLAPTHLSDLSDLLVEYKPPPPTRSRTPHRTLEPPDPTHSSHNSELGCSRSTLRPLLYFVASFCFQCSNAACFVSVR